MLIFAGLGNPGAKYARHRHNIGFMAVEAIADAHGFSPWRKRFQGEVSEGRLGTQKVLLLKPLCYMNESGRSVGEALRFFKLGAEDLVVFHDELDLAPGRCRVKSGGGHAGHNGLRSIHAHVGEAYDRVRLGIGHPGHKSKVAGYVLHDFSSADRDWLDPLLAGIAKAAPKLAEDDAAGFMNAVALEVPKPEKAPKAKAAEEDRADRPAAGTGPAADTGPAAGTGKGATAADTAASSPFGALGRLLSRK